MLPFPIQFQPGQPVYEQVIFAVEKALVLGQLRPGDSFPSLRVLAAELRINPNTAQKIVSRLKQDGVLVVEPGRGTFIDPNYKPSGGNADELLGKDLEQLVVKAKRLGLDLPSLEQALKRQWEAIS